MKRFIRTYWKTLAFFALAGLVGGFFVGLYVMDSYPPELQQQLLAQGMNDTALALVSAAEAAGYGVILGGLGILLGEKTGLFHNETSFEKKPLLWTLAVAVVGGLGIILPDLLFFAHYSDAIAQSYIAKPTVIFMLASVLYGGVIEEVMLRLFMMSLIAFILHKLFGRKSEKPSTAILVTANVIAALLFAAEHLPATAAMMELTPMIVFRCFVLNSGFGLLFGWLYRKYGLRYAMLAHGGCHIISKLIWILFV
ncbi:MAG: CPBP family intramembrane metalloprotease [Oscillospiraceae bacterium]|nr:CPBP family intramembrane metalloprotease [Oscillospiraceae bacterium]